MKSKFLPQLMLAQALLISTSAFAQLPVSTSPQNKKVILEEFTGIYCGFCPDGHKVADQLYAANPNNVILINIHTSTLFGIPKVLGDVDLRTSDGATIDNIINWNGFGWGYPSASFNRSILSQTVIPNPSRPTWSVDANTIMSQPAYCNVALQGTLNVSTRMLTVDAEVYYTGNSPVSTNYLTLMLLEDKVTGRQSNAKAYYPTNINPDSTYNHKHVLRKVISPVWGSPINVTTAGSTFSTQLTYSVPLKYGTAPYDNNCYLGNLEIVGFVSQTQSITINGAKGPIMLTGFTNSLDIAPVNQKPDSKVCEAKLNNRFKFENKGSSTVTAAVFSYSINGTAMPNYSWTGSVNPMSVSNSIFLPVANFSAQANNTIDVEVVSVNGNTDQNPTNNISSTSVPLTPLVANHPGIQVTFLQDQYGNECNWRIYDESNNTVVQSDGPWGVLSASGTQIHTKTFNAQNNKCYKMVVYDGVGNGINSSYGNGYYSISSGTNVMYTSNGQYGDGETIWFKTTITTNVSKAMITVSDMRLYPNPTMDEATLEVEMYQDEKVNLIAMNEIGQLVYDESLDLVGGENTIKLRTENWNAGVYTLKLSSANGSVSKKLIVIK